MTTHAPGSAVGRKSARPKHNLDRISSPTPLYISNKPVRQEPPENDPRPESMLIPDKTANRPVANRHSKAALSAAPAVQGAPRESHSLPARLPAADASDHEERTRKKRKLDVGRIERNEVVRLGCQYADNLIRDNDSLVAERIALQERIDELQNEVEQTEQRSNVNLQQQNLETPEELEICRNDLLTERKEKTELAQTHDDSVRQKIQLEKQRDENAQHCGKLRIELQECRAKHAATNSKLRDECTAWEARLEKSQIQVKVLETAKRDLTLAKETLTTRTLELYTKNALLQTTLEKQAKDSAAQKLRMEEDGQASATREQKLTGRIDELIRTITSLKDELDTERERREVALAATKEAHEARLQEAEEAAEAWVQESRKQVEDVNIELCRLQAQCKQKENYLHVAQKDMEHQVSQMKLNRKDLEQVQLVHELLRESQNQASRGLVAALRGIEEERRVARSSIVAEQLSTQKATQAANKLQEALHSSEAHKMELDRNKKYLADLNEQASRALNEKTVKVAQTQHACKQLEEQLAASRNEVCQRDAQISEKNLEALDRTISRQIKCLQAEKDEGLAELLQMARLARKRVESAKASAEHHVATPYNTSQAELNALISQKTIADNELRALRETLGSQVEPLQAHATCAVQLRWMDDKYQETFDANRSLEDTITDLRAQLATSSAAAATQGEYTAPNGSSVAPISHTGDHGTDPVHHIIPVVTSRETIPERRGEFSSRQLATPLPSTSPTRPACNSDGRDSRTLSILHSDISADERPHQPTAADTRRPREVPTRYRNSAPDVATSQRRRERHIPRGEDLFQHKQKRAPRPPTQPRCHYIDRYRP